MVPSHWLDLLCRVDALFCSLVATFYLSQIAVENMRRKREEEEKARELRNIEARIQRVRTKRQLNEKLKVKSLSRLIGIYVDV